MAARYLARAQAAPVASPPNPLLAAALTVLVPLAVVIIGWALLSAIAIDNSTGYGVSYSGVRTAITQVLDRDLSADRVLDVLTDLPDPTQWVDASAQEKRKTDRAARLKLVAARLNAERARLADSVTSLALQSHPGLAQAVAGAEDAVARRQQMAEIVKTRLDGNAVQKQTEAWVIEALDSRARGGLVNAVVATGSRKAEEVAANAVAASLSIDALQRAAAGAVALRFNAFDTQPGESAWASDVAARLAWAVVALLFVLTFGLVAFTSGVQISRIARPDRDSFLVATALVAAVAGFGAWETFGPANGTTPLHVALENYAQLFGVGILGWAEGITVLRGIGVVLLVAGAVATFWVKITTAAELNEQLRGFKALFNAGAIFLMVGTFEVYAGFYWPTVFAADAATRTALQAAATAFAAAVGAGAAVVMLATYYATTLVLRQQAIAHGVAAADVDTALQTFGFSDMTSQQLLRFAQALMPLVPGAISVLVS